MPDRTILVRNGCLGSDSLIDEVRENFLMRRRSRQFSEKNRNMLFLRVRLIKLQYIETHQGKVLTPVI